ncbi:MAG: serine--tRNA ligase [Eubacteriales bacterium]
MLDIRRIREDRTAVETALAKRSKKYSLQEICSTDEKRRTLLLEVEQLKATRNKVSKDIPTIKKQGGDVQTLMDEMKNVSSRIQELDLAVTETEELLQKLLLDIPNTPHDSVLPGTDEKDNLEVRRFLEPTHFSFEPKPHWEIGTNLGILDFETASKVTGARFVYYVGLGAKLDRAVTFFMLKNHTEKHGYTEIQPPYIAHERSMIGTGQLPKFAEDMFKLEGLDYYLVPTAEVPLTNMYRDSILEKEKMPVYITAHTPCFRAEAGSAGRDTRGLIRQHQFNKVELVKFVEPETSYAELEKLLSNAEEILQLLKLPYRVVQLCGGDLGFSSAKTYDIEVWMPSYGKYVEISSCSNFEDFQARRAGIRYRTSKTEKPQFLHTLNGSGLAVGRTVAAIMENYQQQDGSILIPEVLQEFMQQQYIRGIK